MFDLGATSPAEHVPAPHLHEVVVQILLQESLDSHVCVAPHAPVHFPVAAYAYAGSQLYLLRRYFPLAQIVMWDGVVGLPRVARNRRHLCQAGSWAHLLAEAEMQCRQPEGNTATDGSRKVPELEESKDCQCHAPNPGAALADSMIIRPSWGPACCHLDTGPDTRE